MTDTEISAVAREYAEEIAQEVAVKFNPKDWACSHCEIEAQAVIKFLLRHYCLVEKEAVRKEYESVKNTPEECNYEELGATWDEWPYLSRFYDEGYKLGQKDTIESLFPEIAKEVE